MTPPGAWYLIAGVAVGGLITLALRAAPFAVLKRLRKSRLVLALGRWMPAGIVLILAVSVLAGEIRSNPARVWALLAATAFTVIVHLAVRRRAALSIAAGTGCYIALINLL